MAVLVTRVNRLGIPALRNINASLTDERLSAACATTASRSEMRFFSPIEASKVMK